VWIKVCANTCAEDAQLAADAGADAVGFVFAESSRRVAPAEVRAITTQLPARIEKIGVFANADFAAIAATVEECGLTGVQLHAGNDLDLASRIRESHPQLRILKVIHYGGDLAGQLTLAQQDPAIDGALVDSRTATLIGGTGIPFDWQEAQRSFADTSGLRLIAAGGLTPDNVTEAVTILRPWGVDVATGVELSPGKKDAAKVRAFVEAARIAARNLQLDGRVQA
jgi:phosphoribosylanthranilate isomerase